VTVNQPSFLLPSDQYPTADLEEVMLRITSGGGVIRQDDLWELRQEIIAHNTGLTLDQIEDDEIVNRETSYPIDSDAINLLQITTRNASRAANSDQKLFIVQRIAGFQRGRKYVPPKYVLYVGSELPRFYDGNIELAQLSRDAEAAAGSIGGGRLPLTMVLLGVGEPDDFEAARLTLEAAANVPAPYSFSPPLGFAPPSGGGGANVYNRSGVAPLVISRQEGRKAVMEEFARGSITALAFTDTMLGRMVATVRSFIASPAVALERTRDQVFEDLQERIRQAVNQVFDEYPILKESEAAGPEIRLRTDGQLASRRYAELSIIGPGGTEIRLAYRNE
jgi:hypothetical protein